MVALVLPRRLVSDRVRRDPWPPPVWLLAHYSACLVARGASGVLKGEYFTEGTLALPRANNYPSRAEPPLPSQCRRSQAPVLRPCLTPVPVP